MYATFVSILGFNMQQLPKRDSKNNYFTSHFQAQLKKRPYFNCRKMIENGARGNDFKLKVLWLHVIAAQYEMSVPPRVCLYDIA